MNQSAEQAEPAPEAMSLELRILLKQMQREAHKVKILKRSRTAFGFVWLSSIIGYFVVTRLFGRPFAFSNLSLFNVFNMALLLWSGYINSEMRRKWIKQLAAVQDKRVCGAFADVLTFQDNELKKIAGQALITHLPRMQASDSQLLNDSQRHNLRQALKGKNIDLILALLPALRQVGDMRDWDAVQRLANGKNLAGKNPDVQLAAADCLPYLQANTRRQELNQTLLRPSSADANAGNALLRASMPTTAEQSVELLRAAAPSNEG